MGIMEGAAQGGAAGAAAGSVVPGVGTVIGGLGGALIGGAASFFGQREANQTNLEIARQATQANIASAREQMAFQERMSNTSYQRAVQDLEKAGLNPMLAYMNHGASTPSGASANAATTKVENTISPALATAIQVRALQKELESKDAGIALDQAAKMKNDSETALNTATAGVVHFNARKAQAQLPAVQAEANAAKKEAELRGKYAKELMLLKTFGEGMGIVKDAATTGRMLKGFGFDRGGDVMNKKTGETWNKDEYRPLK